MASPRLKGQEVEAMLIVDGQVKDTITDIRSFEVAAKLEQKEEGYLGEKTNRYDEIFNGVRGRMELHYENGDVFAFMQQVIDRAKRRTPGTQVNIKASLNYPSGERKRVLLRDVYFGEMPFNFSSRSDFGTLSLDFQCEDINVI